MKSGFQLYSEYKKIEPSEKTEYLIIKFDTTFEMLIDDCVEISQIDTFKYLGACTDKDGLGEHKVANTSDSQNSGYLNSLT